MKNFTLTVSGHTKEPGEQDCEDKALGFELVQHTSSDGGKYIRFA
jgi:hypothetical protein